MNISVCLDAVYRGKDFLQSMKEVAGSGIKAIEFWSWWDKDLAQIKKLKDELGLTVSAFCTKFISLVDASQHEYYINGLKESIEAARQLNCKKLISQVGDDLGISREEQQKNMIKGLKLCVPILESEGITLVIEPLNTLVDHPGYYLYSSQEAFEIVDSVGSPHVKVLFDIYHQQIMEGQLINNITSNIDKIGHFHAAGNPGRNELCFGEINYNAVFDAIDTTGYSDYVGFEYFPKEDPLMGLKAFIQE